MAKKKVVKKAAKKIVEQNYWANIYDMAGQVIIQGNTFSSKEQAEQNIYPHWPLLETKIVFKR